MNKTLYLEELPYTADSCEVFERIRDLPGAAMLDSSYPYCDSGRFDILTANNVACDLPTLHAHSTERETHNYFEAVKAFHSERYGGIQPAGLDIPFCGGLLGYLSYEAGKPLNCVSGEPGETATIALTGLKAYDWCIVQDHLRRRAILVALPHVTAAERADISARLRLPIAPRSSVFALGEKFVSSMTREAYRAAFMRVQAYIEAGDCYQVNLAQCFSASYEGDPWLAYKALRAVAAAPYSAFLELDSSAALLSLSPERFLSLHGHHVATAPIKGTRPRHADATADKQAAEDLRNSAKDRAENLMIVDLLRNDIGRSCEPGSIHVERLFELQSFPTVHHLVSTISGELRSELHAVDLLRNSFPGGSITGAPKRRAMEIIAELEQRPRQAYCGSILYISADGRMDSNIAIRTLQCSGQQIQCWGGGGIVADSQWQQEYQETYDKVGRFLTQLETTI